MDGGPLRRFALTAVLIMAALAILAMVFIYSGLYNVAATQPHSGAVRWVLNTTQQRSVRLRGRSVGEKPVFDSAMVGEGFEHYREMCVVCHGAPGVERGEFGKGLNPEPPDLAHAARDLSDEELFWVTKHGIKFTGMPGFGPTHPDAKIWAIVAFLRRLQDMTPQEYARLAAQAASPQGPEEADQGDAGAEAAGHDHAPGTLGHSH